MTPFSSRLYEAAMRRPRPEEVALLCFEALKDQLSLPQRHILGQAARRAHAREGFGFSSMSDEWRQPLGIAGQLDSARRLFPSIPPLPVEYAGDVERVGEYLTQLSAALGKARGDNDFKYSRLKSPARAALGVDMSRRKYNRAFRFLVHLEERFAVLAREHRKTQFARVAKTRLGLFLTRQEFERDLPSACFIAYLSARLNLRSVFTNASQVRAFDEICQMLWEHAQQSPTANWWAMAHVWPDAQVLKHLSDEQRGELFGRISAILGDIGALLEEVWRRTGVQLDTMIVRRGNDSTTWNNAAGAWNRARDGWFALVEALGMDSLLDEFCPGKVPRLMAADVAFWHRATGGQIHPDTRVWAKLPPPWEVFSGLQSCGRALVEQVCASEGVNGTKGGWSAPRPRARVAAFSPTPELVHGVEVWHPVLAQILRDAGAFSGKAKASQAANPAAKAELD